jgi:hypothetical protein
MVDRTVFLGSTTQVQVRLPHGPVLQALVTSNTLPDGLVSGQAVTVSLPTESLRVLASSNGTASLAMAEEPEAV